MALTDDQRAMLRLLAQREQGYEEMAALMGLSVEEVRAKVKDALAAIEQTETEPSPPPPAPPAVKAETPAPTATKVEAPTEASTAQAPPPRGSETEKPLPPPAQKPQPFAPVAQEEPRKRSSASMPRVSLPEDRQARIGLLAGVAVTVLAVLLLVSGVLGGGEDSDSGANDGDTSAQTAAETAAGSDQLTQAVLEPVDGGDASGRALFGRAQKQVVLQVEAEGLDPSPPGQSYVTWLARSPQQMLPLAASKVDESGEIVERYQVPTEVLAFLASGAFDQIEITLISDAGFRRSVAQARKAKQSPAYTGVDVLRGQITGPIVGAAANSQG